MKNTRLRMIGGMVTGIFFGLFLTSNVVAQGPVSVALSDEVGPSDGTFEVAFNVQGNGESRGLQVRFLFLDANVVSVDTSDCLDGFSGALGTDCSFQADPDPDRSRVRVLLNSGGPGTFIEDFTGTIRFTLDGNLDPGDVIALEWDEDFSAATDPDADVEHTDGSLQVELGPQPELEFNPASGTTLNFSATAGSSDEETVEICNIGAAGTEIDINSIDVGTTDNAGGTFSESNDCPATLGVECCTVTVTYNSQNGGNASSTGNLDVVTSEGSGNWPLSGTSTDGPPGDITISPASHDFGDLLSGTESDEFTFTVTNDTGGDGSAVEVDDVSIAGDDTQFSITDDSCTGTLASGASCTVTIEFAPIADGNFSVTLTVSGEDGNGDTQSDTATAEGSGVSEARFSSNPPPGTVNLGTGQGGATLNRNVVISNDGNETLTVDGCVISDPDNAFTFSPDPVTFSIEGDESDTLAVSCVVPEVGSVSAGLTCDTNDPNNESVSYTFTCNSRPLVVSTLQPWGLILLTLMMLAIGGFSIRFFRAS